MSDGPWLMPDQFQPDFSPEAEWHGGPRPSITPASAPGGLVFAIVDADWNELERAVVPAGANPDPAVAIRHGELCAADPTLRLVVYDGDSGLAVMVTHKE